MDKNRFVKRLTALIVILAVGAIAGGGLVYAIVRTDEPASEASVTESYTGNQAENFWRRLLRPLKEFETNVTEGNTADQATWDESRGWLFFEAREWPRWLQPFQKSLEKPAEKPLLDVQLPLGLHIRLPSDLFQETP